MQENELFPVLPRWIKNDYNKYRNDKIIEQLMCKDIQENEIYSCDQTIPTAEVLHYSGIYGYNWLQLNAILYIFAEYLCIALCVFYFVWID